MYVGNIMHRNIISVTPETTLYDALEVTKRNNIRHLLVFDERGRLAGIVSSHDINQTLASPATSLSTHELNYLLDQITVDSFMKKNVTTVTPGTTVERAAYIMQTKKISALPVVEGEKTLGIVTSTDVMGVLLTAIGMDEDTMRLVIYVQNRIGAIAEVSSLMRDSDINIQSLFTWPDNIRKDMCQVVIRVLKRDGETAKSRLSAAGYEVRTAYVDEQSTQP